MKRSNTALTVCYIITSVLILDEAHERTLYTDIAIGLLKKVMSTLSANAHTDCHVLSTSIRHQQDIM